MRISDWSSDVCSSDLTSKVNDDLIAARQAIYSQPGYVDTMRGILCLQEMPIRRRNMITAEQYGSIRAPALVVWTSHDPTATRSEVHTSELQSLMRISYAVFCLKKKKKNINTERQQTLDKHKRIQERT